jgi:hypothetical protein
VIKGSKGFIFEFGLPVGINLQLQDLELKPASEHSHALDLWSGVSRKSRHAPMTTVGARVGTGVAEFRAFII